MRARQNPAQRRGGQERPPQISPERSKIMRSVRRRGTGAEQSVRRLLTRLHVSFDTNAKDLPGSPDLANRRWRIAVFVNGCFWHRHRGCPRATTPKTNRRFWQTKFDANRRRDRRQSSRLRRLGYHVWVVWECQVTDRGKLKRRIQYLLACARRKETR